jgi:hypothetical protein
MTVDAAGNLLPSQSLYPPRIRPAGQFPKDHFWDRGFYPLFVGLIWLGVGLGFGPELVQHIKRGELPYPLVVHLHAVAFVSWVVLLMAARVRTFTRSNSDVVFGLAVTQ